MKSNVLVAIIHCLAFFFLFSCLSQPQKDELLAKQYCSSCHLFPDPSLLDKKTWEISVLPQMSFRMGIDYSLLSSMTAEDQVEVMRTLPGQPMVSLEEWESIKNYYLKNSPDTLHAPTSTIGSQLKQFDTESLKLSTSPLTTFIKCDTLNNKIYVGSRTNKLFQLSEKFVLEDSFQFSSPPSQIRLSRTDDPTVLLMGIMDPNDQPKGELVQFKLKDHTIKKLIDSLKRPVNFEVVDLNRDGHEDVVVSAFGNYSGALVLYKNLGTGKFEKQILQNLPGTRKVILRDFDNNGMIDILALMSQGDEKIILLLNQGSFNFRINTLLSFPPVFGSSYFDVADFNHDGKFDILYSNGDNADYSMILKPYHGIRIYLNNGKNGFTESWFYNMHGASQALAFDFDQDGDLDIAAISFFPDFNNYPEQGFIYFENTGADYLPQITPMAASARWLNLEMADIDHDGDKDLMLGALNFSSGVPYKLQEKWDQEKTSILILRNKAR